VETPPELARRLAEPFASPAGPELLDPACGEGALLLAALELRGGGPGEARRLFGIEIDPERRRRALERLARAALLPPEELEPNLLLADALAPATPWRPGAAVLANPPWLSFSGRQAGPRSLAPRQPGPGGWPSLQGAFLARIAEHCAREGRRARLLLPGSMLELERYAPLRRRVAELAHLEGEVLELGEAAFPGVVEPAVLIELAPGPGGLAGSGPPLAGPDAELLRRLQRFPRLPERSFADPGVHTGNAGKELVGAAARPGSAPLRRGADLAAFDLGAPSRHLRLDLAPGPELRFRIRDLEHYRSFPVLLRQTADRPIAALHTQPTYFRNSLLAARDVEGLAPEFVVALLNSSVAAAWHRGCFRDARQRSFPQVKVSHLRSQPTPLLRRADDPRLHDEVVARCRALDPRGARFDVERGQLDDLLRAAFGLGAAAEAGSVL